MLRNGVLLLLFTVLLSGCSLFSTRNPETPDKGGYTWKTPRVPTDVLDNMSTTLFMRDAVDYMLSFNPDNFHFVADQVTLSRDPSLADWGYTDESLHANKLFSTGTLPTDSVVNLVFTSPTQTLLGDSAQVHAQYSLLAGVRLAGVPHRMAGTADFYMRMGSDGYWQIYRWQDTRTEGENTWSDFKAAIPLH